jgi:hypothetical protein
MLPKAVKLAVTASVPMECEFWTEDDGWKDACVELSVNVHGSNFEEAKPNMGAALQPSAFSNTFESGNGNRDKFWFKTRNTQTIHRAWVPLYSLLLFTGHYGATGAL